MSTTVKGTEHYVNRPDGRAYYTRVGSGEPVVFIHGAGGNAENWADVVKDFSGHFTCISVDLPGYDHADSPKRKYTIVDFAQAVLDIMDDARLARAALVGTHTGAVIAAHIAVTQPQRVSKIICDGLPYWTKESGRLVFERSLLPGMTDTTSYDVAVTPIASWENFLKGRPNATREDYERYLRLQQKSRLWNRYTLEGTTSYDVQEIGPKVTQPVLVMFGEGDGLRRGEAKIRETINGVKVEVIAGCKGTVAPTKPAEFFRIGLDFLRAGQ